MYGYIYLIINKVNGKTYIGKRKSPKKWYEDTYMGSGKRLYSAKKHYGIGNFEKFLICYTSSEKDACEKEVFWIAEYKKRGKAEYNIQNGGQGGGFPWTPEMREKLEGRKRSTEARKRMSDSHKGQVAWNKGKPSSKKGCHLSEETKKKIAESQKGKHPSEETLKKLSESHKGKHWKLVDGKRVWY